MRYISDDGLSMIYCHIFLILYKTIRELISFIQSVQFKKLVFKIVLSRMCK